MFWWHIRFSAQTCIKIVVRSSLALRVSTSTDFWLWIDCCRETGLKWRLGIEGRFSDGKSYPFRNCYGMLWPFLMGVNAGSGSSCGNLIVIDTQTVLDIGCESSVSRIKIHIHLFLLFLKSISSSSPCLPPPINLLRKDERSPSTAEIKCGKFPVIRQWFNGIQYVHNIAQEYSILYSIRTKLAASFLYLCPWLNRWTRVVPRKKENKNCRVTPFDLGICLETHEHKLASRHIGGPLLQIFVTGPVWDLKCSSYLNLTIRSLENKKASSGHEDVSKSLLMTFQIFSCMVFQHQLL